MEPGLQLAPESPTAPIVTCGSLCRSADHYRRVVDQFDVENNPRYKPGKHTYCNIFEWDVTRAMGAEIPHWLLGRELNANAVFDWLVKYGAEFGWLSVDQVTARAWANAGCPVVVVWRNPMPEHSGHIAMVVPDEPGIDGPTIAQAGGTNHRSCSVARGFGNPGGLRFYAHP